MPNWAMTYYVAEGDKEQLKELHAIIIFVKGHLRPLGVAVVRRG